MVHDSEHDVHSRQPAGVANPGLIRPPFVYLGSIGLGLLVHVFCPVPVLPASVSVPIGVLVVLVAGALFISAVRTFRKAGTPIPGNRPTTTIVRTGPYGFSRNPIYLAFTLFQVGLAAWVNSLGVLLMLLPGVAPIFVRKYTVGEICLQKPSPASWDRRFVARKSRERGLRFRASGAGRKLLK